MNTADSELAVRVVNGDHEAAVILVENHYRPIYAFLRRLAGNEADAADLTQKTFVRVWTSLAGFMGRSSLRSWLHGIAYHVYVDWLRANHHDTSPSDEWWQQQPDHRPGPDHQACSSDLATSLYRAVDSLPADLRIPVHLHYYQGLTLDDTALASGIAASTVKYRLRQALDLLQKQLRETPTSITNLNPIPRS